MKPVTLILLSLFLVTGAVAYVRRNSSAVASDEWEDSVVSQLSVSPSDQKHVQNAQKGLDVFQKFVSIFTADNFKDALLKIGLKAVAQMASGALGAVGAIISFIMGLITGNTESAEMKFMREQFKEVNAKLDNIFLKLDEVKALIEWRTTRVMYSEFEIFIQATSIHLDNFIVAPANEREHRRRIFLESFKTKRNAALKLFQAITSNSHSVTENLAGAAVQYTRNHRRQVMSFLLAMQRLILRGAEMEIAYERLEHGEQSAEMIRKDWDTRIETLVTRIKEVNDQIESVWHKQMETDVDNIIRGEVTRDLSNKDFSRHLYRYLTDKFDWLHWFVIAYNPVTGYHVHSVGGCRLYPDRFRTSPGRSRNLVVSWSDGRWSRFTQARGDSWLEAAESARHGTANTEVWFHEIDRRINLNDCNDAALRVTLCWGCDVWFSGRSDRYSYRRINVHGNLHAILFG